MHIGRFYFERWGFWFKWFWQYTEREHGYTQHKHGRSELRDPFIMLWMLVWQPVKLLGAALVYVGAFMQGGKAYADDCTSSIW